MTKIRVRYSSIDHFRMTRTFKTLKGAKAFAVKYVGEYPEVSVAYGYAVSGDGVGKVEVSGEVEGKAIGICDLFPDSSVPYVAHPLRVPYVDNRGIEHESYEAACDHYGVDPDSSSLPSNNTVDDDDIPF